MPHRRHYGSRRKFKDGEYRMLTYATSTEELDMLLRRYERAIKPGQKVRYIRGQNGCYFIYFRDTPQEPTK